MRRSALPNVVPKPRSKGPTEITARLGLYSDGLISICSAFAVLANFFQSRPNPLYSSNALAPSVMTAKAMVSIQSTCLAMPIKAVIRGDVCAGDIHYAELVSHRE